MEGVIATFHLRRSEMVARYDLEGQHSNNSLVPSSCDGAPEQTPAREEKQQRCISPLPCRQLSGRDWERSCSQKHQQIFYFFSTVNPSGTEVPKDTLKISSLLLCKRSQRTNVVLRPRATADTEAFCRPDPGASRAATGDGACGLSACLWLRARQLCSWLDP